MPNGIRQRNRTTYSQMVDEIADARSGTRSIPVPIVLIHALAGVGILFWLSMIVQAVIGEADNWWGVVILGFSLGGAHVAISWFTHRRSRLVFVAMWFVLVSDAALALVVDRRAILLVLFTVVLLLLTRAPSARRWFDSPR